MSTQIYYEHLIVRIPAESIEASEDQYLQLTLDGASNTYNFKDQRVRKWSIHHFGTAEQIMATAIAHSYYFAGGMSSWKCNGSSGHLKPQQWIAKVRNAIARAKAWQPEMTPIVFNDSSYITLRAQEEVEDKTLLGIVKALYQHSLQLKNADSPWGHCFWRIAKVSGPGER
ncbi:hypothetical protein [Comamonas thiooxydans]|uniref:hypothetical protein n=1 Tax=Comamonas thiooxydans TaxID=363952 RepID=UPI00050E6E62|nr:hypothetical protein [Comamonas thiooxydans]KGH23602.1 hypothetical protein P606_11845 [Comamonas thiooxydans]